MVVRGTHHCPFMGEVEMGRVTHPDKPLAPNVGWKSPMSPGVWLAKLSRRIGMCNSYFKSLSRLWKHTSIPRTRKLEISNALICSKFLYGLSTMWRGLAEQRKLDGFPSACLRKITGSAPAYHARAANAAVMQLCLMCVQRVVDVDEFCLMCASKSMSC